MASLFLRFGPSITTTERTFFISVLICRLRASTVLCGRFLNRSKVCRDPVAPQPWDGTTDGVPRGVDGRPPPAAPPAPPPPSPPPRPRPRRGRGSTPSTTPTPAALVITHREGREGDRARSPRRGTSCTSVRVCSARWSVVSTMDTRTSRRGPEAR